MRKQSDGTFAYPEKKKKSSPAKCKCGNKSNDDDSISTAFVVLTKFNQDKNL